MVEDPMKIQEIIALASSNGLSVHECSPGHHQIRGGAYKVDLWPRTGTWYVHGSVSGNRGRCRPQRIINAALGSLVEKKGHERKNSKWMSKVKKRLFENHQCCHWCQTPLTLETATIDHLVPLSRGGSNYLNNLVLSCRPCNAQKGSLAAPPPSEEQS